MGEKATGQSQDTARGDLHRPRRILMAYQVKFSKQAAKFFRKLEPHIKERIREKFREIAEDPFRYAEHFEGDGHKIRIGDFRALVDIYQEAQKILVRVLDKRGRVYK